MILGVRCCLFSLLSVILATMFPSPFSAFAQSKAQEAPTTRRERRKGVGATDIKYEISVGDVTRTYLLHVPELVTRDHLAPLLLVFHGGGGHDYNMPRFTGFNDLSDSRGFLVAYPESFNTHWNDTRPLSPADDVGFVRALIVEVKRSYPVDPARLAPCARIRSAPVFNHCNPTCATCTPIKPARSFGFL